MKYSIDELLTTQEAQQYHVKHKWFENLLLFPYVRSFVSNWCDSGATASQVAGFLIFVRILHNTLTTDARRFMTYGAIKNVVEKDGFDVLMHRYHESGLDWNTFKDKCLDLLNNYYLGLADTLIKAGVEGRCISPQNAESISKVKQHLVIVMIKQISMRTDADLPARYLPEYLASGKFDQVMLSHLCCINYKNNREINPLKLLGYHIFRENVNLILRNVMTDEDFKKKFTDTHANIKRTWDKLGEASKRKAWCAYAQGDVETVKQLLIEHA